ncbi:hypothetical protein [Actinoplanes couchii]|uniref:acyl-CoA-like ligand-binding transcription factor n=1 Tax=Actinoplanes couchii TaxID=403638 RepID=UPI001EF16F0A|nr:hypothetical protein [Actinoplanes couchii]MDR6319360.1 hypothetical protein [Actinoplanes couchii]
MAWGAGPGSANAEAELAAAVAERTGTDLTTDMYPRLVAAAAGTAMQHYLDGGDPTPIEQLITEAFTQITPGPPPP